MKPLTAAAVVAVVLGALDAGLFRVKAEATLSAQQGARPARDTPNRRTAAAPGLIAGRVTAADTGIPLRLAIVAASGPAGLPREVMTNDEGRFELRDLEPGAWQLTVSRSGYISRKSGQSRPFGRTRPIAVGSGQQISIDVPLTRASAIAGRIYDEFGEPVTAARVTVLRARMANERRYLEPVGEGDQTDDTGAFRLHSLPAGDYYVTASARIAPPDSVVQTTLSPTYYPGTGDFAAAQKVRVTPGADAFVSFPLLPVRTARINGFIITSQARPGDAFLSLTSEAAELGMPFGAGAVTREDGSFTIADVPPGNYTLVAELRSGVSSIAEMGSVAITVNGRDIEGLSIATAKPGTLRGTIVADAGVKRALPAAVDIAARPRRAGAQPTYASATGSSFEMIAPPGPFTFEVDAPDGWAVKSVTLGGFDASDLAIDIAGEQGVAVTVVLTDRLTDVSGTVAGADDDGAHVVVFPADSGNWTRRRVRSAQTDARGRFRIVGLPPAERYLAVAVRELDEGQEADPEFLQQVQAAAAAFDLAADEKKVLDLKVLAP
jgi:hypothetical protein